MEIQDNGSHLNISRADYRQQLQDAFSLHVTRALATTITSRFVFSIQNAYNQWSVIIARKRSCCFFRYWDPHIKFHKNAQGTTISCLAAADVQFPHRWFSTLITAYNVTFGDQPTAQGLHRRMLLVILLVVQAPKVCLLLVTFSRDVWWDSWRLQICTNFRLIGSACVYTDCYYLDQRGLKTSHSAQESVFNIYRPPSSYIFS